MDPDPYAILGVSRDADLRAVKRAFRALALKFHPDRGGATSDAGRFREARDAYDLLMDPERRRELDRRLAARDRRARSGATAAWEAGAAARGLYEDLVGAVIDAIFWDSDEPRKNMGGEGLRSTERGFDQRFEGRVSGSGRVEVDAYLTRAEARFGTTLPFRFQLGPRLIARDVRIGPGVRRGDRLEFEIPFAPGEALELIVHIDVEDS